MNPFGASNLSPHCLLLPYLERATLLNSINFQINAFNFQEFDPGNATAASFSIDTFLCPSDSAGRVSPFGCVNYRANNGVCNYCEDENQGAFGWAKPVGPPAVLDGLFEHPVIRGKVDREWFGDDLRSPEGLGLFANACDAAERGRVVARVWVHS